MPGVNQQPGSSLNMHGQRVLQCVMSSRWLCVPYDACRGQADSTQTVNLTVRAVKMLAVSNFSNTAGNDHAVMLLPYVP